MPSAMTRDSLQTSAGYKRIMSVAESLLIEPFNRDERFTIMFLNQSFVIATRNCVLLMQQRAENIKCSQEELKLPENIRHCLKKRSLVGAGS
jgi:hypothetical protein